MNLRFMLVQGSSLSLCLSSVGICAAKHWRAFLDLHTRGGVGQAGMIYYPCLSRGQGPAPTQRLILRALGTPTEGKSVAAAAPGFCHPQIKTESPA